MPSSNPPGGGGVSTLNTLNGPLTIVGAGAANVTQLGNVITVNASVAGGAVTISANNSIYGNIAGTGQIGQELNGTQVTALLDPVTSLAKGLAPASGGGTNNFLRADGTWTAPPGSNTGTVTGGAGGTTGLTLSGTTTLTLGGTLGITSGGTGAITAPLALVALGAAPVANPTFTGVVNVPAGALLGTPTSLTLTNATGLPLGGTGVTGLLPLAKGGSGTATPALVPGTNITISGTWPNQTINATGGVSTPATASVLGLVKVGTGLAIDGAGLLSSTVTGGVSTPATASVLGLVKVGSGLAVDGAGLLSATGTAGVGSINGTSGAITLSPGLSMVGQTLTVTAGGVGTVTSVTGSGGTTGLTLSGSITSSGALTLGGTLGIGSGGTGAITAPAALAALGAAPSDSPVFAGSVSLPYWTSAGRPSPATAGMIGWNTTLGRFDHCTLAGSPGTWKSMIRLDGDTMTGLLTLSGAPTANLHAATKQYVDGLVVAPSTITPSTSGVAAVGTELTFARADHVHPLATNLGTPTAITLTNAVGLPLSTGISGVLAVANGGTGVAALPRTYSWFRSGTPTNSETLIYLPVDAGVKFLAGLTAPSASYVKAKVGATASFIFTFSKNGVAFATATFAAGGSAGAQAATILCAADTAFASGDILSVSGQPAADVSLADIGFSLSGVLT